MMNKANKQAMDKFKYEVANELGVNLKEGYNGDLTAKENGFSDIEICPETMGKINQLGILEEIVEMCKIDEMLVPTIDFGHINAREMGSLKTEEDFEKIVRYMIDELGEDRGRRFHVHFSKIEYTTGGEKRHLTFEDTEYGPDFEPLAEALKMLDLEPVVICESAGTQAEDAMEMKRFYFSKKNLNIFVYFECYLKHFPIYF